jgi:hypothetical protein
MKSRIAVAAAILAGTMAGATEGGAVDRRQATQQARIGNGVASGTLTPREAIRLESRAVSIARLEASFRATGAGLSHRERAILDHRLDTLSDAIWREKHDGQARR